MRYANIIEDDVVNGYGIGVALFVQGCYFRCSHCFNSQLWDFNGGEKWSSTVENNVMNMLNRPYISRCSILGGEPLSQDSDLLHLVKRIKAETNKTIWLWTGFKIEDLNDFQKQIVNYVDVLVDGQFVESKKDLRLQFRGSNNQRIIDIPKTKEQGKIVLWQSND